MFLNLKKKNKKIFYIKYIKKNNILLLEKKKITNIYIDLHFLIMNYKLEHQSDLLNKNIFHYFSIKKFFY